MRIVLMVSSIEAPLQFQALDGIFGSGFETLVWDRNWLQLVTKNKKAAEPKLIVEQGPGKPLEEFAKGNEDTCRCSAACLWSCS